MNLSVIRRILLLILICVIVIDGGMLLYVKFAGEKQSGITVDIVAFSQAESHASQLKQQLLAEGMKVSVLKVKHEFDTPKGFRVVIRNEDKTILAPIYDALVFKKQPVSYAENKGCIVYGKVYPDKAKADAAVKKAKDAAGVNFDVEPNMVKITKDAYKMVINEVPEEKSDELQQLLSDNTFQDLKIKQNVTVAESDSADSSSAEDAKTEE